MNHIIESTPFPVFFALGVVAIVVGWRLFGIKGATVAAAIVGMLHLFREGRQDGRQSQVTKARKEADHAVKEATTARVDAAVRDADPERLRDDDGFKRD